MQLSQESSENDLYGNVFAVFVSIFMSPFLFFVYNLSSVNLLVGKLLRSLANIAIMRTTYVFFLK